MDKNLSSYVRVYSGFLDNEFCKETVEQLKNAEFNEHKFYLHGGADNAQDLVSYEKELSVSWDTIPNYNTIQDKLWKAIYRYIVEDTQDPNFSGWSGYTAIRFNRYETGTRMKRHVDHIKDMFDGERKGNPTLSIVGLLNDDYEGGEFVMWDDTKIELKTGDLLMFPSNFLYPHVVNEITKGTRYSYVSWVW